jgi:hypothetical protein
VPPRPGVLQLMDDARAAGLKVAVCSAATKSSVVFTLKSLLGEQRFDSLDCFLAGKGLRKARASWSCRTTWGRAAADVGLWISMYHPVRITYVAHVANGRASAHQRPHQVPRVNINQAHAAVRPAYDRLSI